MTVIEVSERSEALTLRQRWSHFLVFAFFVVGMMIAINIRSAFLNATSLYENLEVGVRAQYPQNWLLTEGADGAVFSVQNASEIGFKTIYRFAVRPIGSGTTVRNVADVLTLERSRTLAAYRVLSVEPISVTEDLAGQMVTYTYVDTELNPFLERIPPVVVGVDVLFVSRGQVVIVTLLSDSQRFLESRDQFLSFVGRLEF